LKRFFIKVFIVVNKDWVMSTFQELGLSEKNVFLLREKGFVTPTEIQAKTIPAVLVNDRDIIAQAQTGTGKTAAFALPLIELIERNQQGIKALILAPTRELVIQICAAIQFLKGEDDLEIVPIYGGQSIVPQLKRLKKGVDIVVGTPGRILDHVRRKTLKLDALEFFILDEADEMLDMGFIEDIEEILTAVTPERRVLLFSATMPERIKKLAEKFMGDYHHISTMTKGATHPVEQMYIEIAQKDKFDLLHRMIDLAEGFYGLVFCRTRSDVDEVAERLVSLGFRADALHGDIAQAQREKILRQFRNQQTSILVATDVAARGIDVNNLTHVINFSIPQSPEAYIHRIGRTGRAGNAGMAITFVTRAEYRSFNIIQKKMKAAIRKEHIPSIEEVLRAKQNRIVREIEKQRKSGHQYSEMAVRLLENNSLENVLASTLQYFLGSLCDLKVYQEISNEKSYSNCEAKFKGRKERQQFFKRNKRQFSRAKKSR